LSSCSFQPPEKPLKSSGKTRYVRGKSKEESCEDWDKNEKSVKLYNSCFLSAPGEE